MWGLYPFWNGRSQTVFGNVPTAVLLLLALFCAGQAPRLHTCTYDHMDAAGFRVARLHSELGELCFRQPGDLGLILLAAALPYAGEFNLS